MNYKLLTMLVCALFFSLNAQAQVNITGTVTDANTGESLPGVNVFIQQLKGDYNTKTLKNLLSKIKPKHLEVIVC